MHAPYQGVHMCQVKGFQDRCLTGIEGFIKSLAFQTELKTMHGPLRPHHPASLSLGVVLSVSKATLEWLGGSASIAR